MKRNLLFLFILFMASLGNISCGGDDDSSSNSNGRYEGDRTDTDTPATDDGGGSGSSISLQDGDIIPDRVLADPLRYGFSLDTVLVVYRYNYGSNEYIYTHEDMAWTNEGGCFVTGSDVWNNTYIRMYYNQSNHIRTEDGVIVMDGKERYAMYDDLKTFVAIIPNQNVKAQKVLFGNGYGDGDFTTSHQGPFYSAAVDALYTSAISFDVHTDDFSIDDVQASTSASWLTVSKIMLNYKKGDIASGESTYDHSMGSVWWYTSENTTGSERSGYIYVTLKADGETYNYTLHVTQRAYSSGSGSDSGSGSGSGSGSSGKYSNWSKSDFQNLYNQYARTAESTYKSYSTIKSGNSSYVALSSLRSEYRSIQSEMRELREAASRAGYTLVKSVWETTSLP